MILRISYETREKLLKRYPKIETCLKCSLCAFKDGYGCYVSNYGVGVDGTKFNALDTFTYNIFGADEPAKNPNLWLCVSCHRCHDICPYDVNPTEVIESLKATAFESGNAPDLIRDEVSSIVSTGFAFPVVESQRAQRDRLHLPALETPPLEDLEKIAKRTNLDDRLTKLRRREAGK
ncbi:MAG: hypothetical protein QXI32_00885 [Candidatus Bathyarchaeia archaeon]